MVAGRRALSAATPTAATAFYLTLRSQGERLSGLLYWMSQRVRTAHEIACALEAGESAAQIKRKLRMPSKAADRLIADANRSGSEQAAAHDRGARRARARLARRGQRRRG